MNQRLSGVLFSAVLENHCCFVQYPVCAASTLILEWQAAANNQRKGISKWPYQTHLCGWFNGCFCLAIITWLPAVIGSVRQCKTMILEVTNTLQQLFLNLAPILNHASRGAKKRSTVLLTQHISNAVLVGWHVSATHGNYGSHAAARAGHAQWNGAMRERNRAHLASTVTPFLFAYSDPTSSDQKLGIISTFTRDFRLDWFDGWQG